MEIDWNKITSSTTFKVVAWIVIPTVLVGGFYGVKYVRENGIGKNKLFKKDKPEETKEGEAKELIDKRIESQESKLKVA